MALPFDSGSRFQSTEKLFYKPLDGKATVTYGMWVPPSFLTRTLDSKSVGNYQVISGYDGRPDYVSSVLYGTPYLDWVLIAFNKAQDVVNWPAVGTIIQYPLPQVVFAEID